jgi:hypothetical protein
MPLFVAWMHLCDMISCSPSLHCMPGMTLHDWLTQDKPNACRCASSIYLGRSQWEDADQLTYIMSFPRGSTASSTCLFLFPSMADDVMAARPVEGTGPVSRRLRTALRNSNPALIECLLYPVGIKNKKTRSLIGTPRLQDDIYHLKMLAMESGIGERKSL